MKVSEGVMQENFNDFWNELSSEQQQEIEKADLEIEQGETVDYETFMEKYR